MWLGQQILESDGMGLSSGTENHESGSFQVEAVGCAFFASELASIS